MRLRIIHTGVPSEIRSDHQEWQKVYVDDKGSHAATHLEDTPELLDLVKEIVKSSTYEVDSVVQDYDMGRVVGTTDCVDVNEDDDIFYARRKNRDGYTKFVRNIQPTPCKWVTLIIDKNEDGYYTMRSCWVGGLAPTFPGKNEMSNSRDFWSTRALVDGAQEYDESTVTKECPW